MRFNSRTWFLLSLLLFLAAAYFWRLGNEQQSKKSNLLKQQQPRPKSQRTTGPFHLLTSKQSVSEASVASKEAGQPGIGAGAARRSARSRIPYRLANTEQSVDQLARNETAILLRNALIVTANAGVLELPEHLRSERGQQPTALGSYLVQSRGPVNDSFRSALAEAGAAIISYIPNNAFLVRVTAEGAGRLESAIPVQAVLPYEPYYKLDERLLPLAIERRPLAAESWLKLTLFPGEFENALADLTGLGFEIISEDRSPFGPQLVVRSAGDGLVELANLSSVHLIETYYRRRPANDLSRVRVGISPDPVTAQQHLDLTGSNILVNLNDTGVDASHPDLVGRVFTQDTNQFTLVDFDGHGTHVGGTIASSGGLSGTLQAEGSLPNASYRGMAPAARLFVLPIDLLTGPLISDAYLQETAATNQAFISNNSWNYIGAQVYNTSAASYDAAVRDALPNQPGAQPLLYVFAAGNSGEGNDLGLGGLPNSIDSPGTAKNVITVGAIEQFRNFTNEIVKTDSSGNTSTNAPFLGFTDSTSEVASFSSRGNVGPGVEGEFGRFKPDLVAPGTFVVSTRARNWRLVPSIPELDLLSQLNNAIGPNYRYESGTSMAAPVVSGVLALMQEFFEQRLQRTPSPALMKALLINGARSFSLLYDFEVRTSINFQGWGLVNLTNSLPASLAAGPETDWPIRFVDQSSTNVLATGEKHTWNLKLSDDARNFPLRVTLVWTDPPGNPGAGIKLVNDLDLVITNLDTEDVYFGNNILDGSTFTAPNGTNSLGTNDVINNVENIFIPEPLGTNYTVSVVGRRVNVNAVTANTNAVVQDYALVLSTDNSGLTGALQLTRAADQIEFRPLTVITNGVPLLHQRVGANFPLTNSNLGVSNQWNFYLFTNTFVTNAFGVNLTNGSNVAFITFLPPNLGRPRNLEADIDLYVSTDPRLVTLDPAVVAASDKSTNRTGTQVVFFTNAPLDTVFYIGVKSEDQQAGEFALAGISSARPFDETDATGARIVHGFPLNADIPDGSPERPGAVQIFGIATAPLTVQRAMVTNLLVHESIGDLIGNLSHNNQFVVLNNHTVLPGIFGTNFTLIYDDSNASQFSRNPFIRRSDGPGSLNNFIGDEGLGLWLLTMVDNAPTHAGRVVSLDVRLEPQDPAGTGTPQSVLANRFAFFFVNVPSDVIRMTVSLSQMDGPLNVYARRGDFPSTTVFDKAAFLNPPGGALTIGTTDVPPLIPGRYIIGVFNPTATTVNFRIRVDFEPALGLDIGEFFPSLDTPLLIADEAVTQSSLFVDETREVIDARVAVRIDHPRAGDLVLRLISPQGTRVLLTENRGGLSTNGFGSGFDTVTFARFTENTNLASALIKFAAPPFSTNVTTNRFPISDFETSAARFYNKGEIVDGWTVEEVLDAGGTNQPSPPAVVSDALGANSGIHYLSLGVSRIARLLPTEAGKAYSLSFAYRKLGAQLLNGQLIVDGVLHSFFTAGADWQTKTISFIARNNGTLLELGPAITRVGLLVDNFILITAGGFIDYVPEESLKALEGESALGDWTLEVLDNRAGPGSALRPQLISWQLQLTLTPTNPAAVFLTNGVPHTNTVAGDEIKFFIVDVPRFAFGATNILFGTGDLVLHYHSTGLPVGNSPPDDALVDFFGPGGIEFLILNTLTPPQLRPGQRYYLGVSNANRNETNAFVILVNIGVLDTSLFNLTQLVNGVAVTNTIAVTNALDYYQFTVSSNANSVTFELFPQDGNADLFVRKALPVVGPLPTPENFDYLGNDLGTNTERIIIVTNSIPVPLSPGDWYLGVFNADTNPVTYSIRATEEVPPTIINLTNGVPVNFSVAPGAVMRDFFLFTITNSSPGALFELFNLSGNADLLAQQNRFPDTNSFFAGARGSIGNPARLFIATNTPGAEILNGDWFLGVLNHETNRLNFSVRATLIADLNPTINAVTNNLVVTNTIAGANQFDYYEFNVSTNAKAVEFELIPGNGNVDLFVKKDLPVPSELFFDYASENGGLSNELIRIRRGSLPVTLTPGRWYIGVRNREDFAVTYSLRAEESLIDEIIDLPEDVALPSLSLTNSADFYRISVSSNAVSAQVEIFGSGNIANLDLFLRKNLPLPNPANFDYRGTQASATNEILVWSANSSPVPLSPGPWYLAVTNSGMGPLPYQIRFSSSATNIAGPSTNLVINPQLQVTSEAVCLSWSSVPGRSYHVEGKTNVEDRAWNVISPTITATNATTSFCVPFTRPERFFRVVQETSATGSVPSLTANNLQLTANGFTLSWTAPTNEQFKVQFSTNLVDWLTFTNVLSSTDGTFIFRDDGSQTGGVLPGLRFYRLIRFP